MVLHQAQQSAVTGWLWSRSEWWLLAAMLGVGVLAALIPAWLAYRSDVAPILAEG
jgi:putative ABC transport system permease protein